MVIFWISDHRRLFDVIFGKWILEGLQFHISNILDTSDQLSYIKVIKTQIYVFSKY